MYDPFSSFLNVNFDFFVTYGNIEIKEDLMLLEPLWGCIVGNKVAYRTNVCECEIFFEIADLISVGTPWSLSSKMNEILFEFGFGEIKEDFTFTMGDD